MISIDFKLVKALAAEFLCTFFFIFTICAVQLNFGRLNFVDPVASGLSTFLVALAIIYTFGPLSGAHFNPSVTFGALICGKIGIVKGIAYIVLQINAGLLAMGLLIGLYPNADIAGLVLHPKPGTSWIHALLMEFVLTFILVYVIYAVAIGAGQSPRSIEDEIESQEDMHERRLLAAARANFAPLAIAATLGFLCFMGGSTSGGAFNPVRATAPAFITFDVLDLWVYWVGGLSGGAAAAVVHTFFFAT